MWLDCVENITSRVSRFCLISIASRHLSYFHSDIAFSLKMHTFLKKTSWETAVDCRERKSWRYVPNQRPCVHCKYSMWTITEKKIWQESFIISNHTSELFVFTWPICRLAESSFPTLWTACKPGPRIISSCVRKIYTPTKQMCSSSVPSLEKWCISVGTTPTSGTSGGP